MAINRADYQYIRNTLPSQQSTISDSALKIGSTVKNLLPELIDNAVLKEKSAGWSPQDGWLWEKDTTIKNGTLYVYFPVEMGKTYVIQVNNALDNNIKNEVWCEQELLWSFDNYLYFCAPRSADYMLKISGVSFSYALFSSVEGEEELRSVINPSKAKVIVFESDQAFIVDSNYVINGFSNTSLVHGLSTTPYGLQPQGYELTKLNQILSNPPEFEILKDGRELKINLTNNIIHGKWQFEYNYSITPPQLIIFRDFLTTTRRKYNDKFIDTRYGKMVVMQNNQNAIGDPNASNMSVRTTDFPYSNWDSTGYSVSYIIDETQKRTDTTKKDPTLGDMSGLGSNWQYSINQGFDATERFKYTSVSFAWGVKYNKYSPMSIPLIIDRSITDEDFETGQIKFVEDGFSKYYADKHIALMKR